LPKAGGKHVLPKNAAQAAALIAASIKVLLSAFSPAGGSKFSPNLYRWLQRDLRRYGALVLPGVFAAKDGTLWIGRWHDDYFVGVRLIEVLCSGLEARKFAYRKLDVAVVGDFWARYASVGRCAIDVTHQEAFIGDELRWQTDGARRSCLWCRACVQTKQIRTEQRQIETWSTKGEQ
jgi:hypothetical protein